ncbi:OLC1v1035999C1 [Oldenlandia corymbosa var. corymbosa]|uniref:OLC1v1035999C1 n=1 Tax=Oldenlandia corymbosa var. corymbosa TaxID=529605 RepID=A0AAV1CUE5_OLDCO|nr:OLC1v1035999C1 [Oldenlandia corymbosa var. corymbosa]
MLPFKVVNQGGKPYLTVEMKSSKIKLMSPKEIISMMLKGIKQKAKSHLGMEIEEVVLTHPAFTFSNAQVQTIQDAGAIVGLKVNVGGEDFDHRVMDYCLNLIKNKYNRDISGDKQAVTRLIKECEKAKKVLCDQPRVDVKIDSLFDGVDFSEPLSRETFKELNMDLF